MYKKETGYIQRISTRRADCGHVITPAAFISPKNCGAKKKERDSSLSIHDDDTAQDENVYHFNNTNRRLDKRMQPDGFLSAQPAHYWTTWGSSNLRTTACNVTRIPICRITNHPWPARHLNATKTQHISIWYGAVSAFAKGSKQVYPRLKRPYRICIRVISSTMIGKVQWYQKD